MPFGLATRPACIDGSGWRGAYDPTIWAAMTSCMALSRVQAIVCGASLLAIAFGYVLQVSGGLDGATGMAQWAVAAGFFGWRPGGTGNPNLPGDPQNGSEGELGADLTEIVHALDIAAIVLDGERRIVAFNRHAADLFPSISVGAPVALATRNPELLLSIDRVFSEGRTETTEFTERMLQGRRFIVTSTLLSGARLLLQFRDTSEQERLAQLRADFIANASHELRTPLASIKGFIETLQGPAREDAAARTRFLGIMAAQSQRMNRILDDLLSLSRIEMRAHLKPEGTVELGELIAHVMRGLEPLAQQADIALKYVSLTDAVHVRGDRDELEQVLQNLVHNAIKYGRSGGTVDVTIAQRGAQRPGRTLVAITVADDGPGIPPEHLPRLTERFYRVDTARSREKGGTGLGLAIVKHILNRHKGELEITSEIGRGSQFTVILGSSGR
jgi:two-component system phosphate regulon sensor histidine kinase PhoR